jgi:hypothetical protein
VTNLEKAKTVLIDSISVDCSEELFKHLFWKSKDYEVPLKIFKQIVACDRAGMDGRKWDDWAKKEGISRPTIYFYLRELKDLGMIKRDKQNWRKSRAFLDRLMNFVMEYESLAGYERKED